VAGYSAHSTIILICLLHHSLIKILGLIGKGHCRQRSLEPREGQVSREDTQIGHRGMT
jgi:hypothetical protein